MSSAREYWPGLPYTIWANSHGGASLALVVFWKSPFLTSSPLHCGPEVGVAEEVVEVLDVDSDDVVDVVSVVGPGVMRQEHPDDTLEAGYCET